MPSTLDDNRFLEWLQEQLDKREWNRQRLAEKADVYPSVIGKLMNREVGLGPDLARRLAAALGISQYEMFQRAGLINEELLDDDKAAKEYLRLLAAIEDDDEREATVELVEGIIRQVAARRKEARARGQDHSRPGRRPATGHATADG